ncbi:Growth-regulating factor 4 [Forsythia ovata]|uniref:Growth-regulating factor n=1 Tax=Forsythia ovata TaxID=205694 RepID=A0ABD1T9G0_9LAMI
MREEGRFLRGLTVSCRNFLQVALGHDMHVTTYARPAAFFLAAIFLLQTLFTYPTGQQIKQKLITTENPMEFNLKQWREELQESAEEDQPHSAKLPRLLLDPHPQHQQPPGMESSFSLAQWQEVELQALIFRHMLAGAAVPPELLHLVKKSLISSHSPYLFSHPIQHYYPHYQTTLLQTGYCGRGAMDPEPGRCRRTDGKKWRCSREVVAGQKYCERHINRGRNRSRKPVDPTSSAIPYGRNAGSDGLKTNNFIAAQTLSATAAAAGSSVILSRPSLSTDLLYLNQRPSESIIDIKGSFEASSDGKSDGQTLRPFFNKWSRPLQETDNAASPVASATNLTISIAENPSSDFSLKLSTGDVDDSEPQVVITERDMHQQLNWDATRRTNPMAPMGGPLAEALRSSTFPTSVLRQLHPCSTSEASYVGT